MRQPRATWLNVALSEGLVVNVRRAGEARVVVMGEGARRRMDWACRRNGVRSLLAIFEVRGGCEVGGFAILW